MKIFKYPINMFGKTEIEMPENTLIISAAEQYGQICIWAEVDEEEGTETRAVWSIPTGDDHDFTTLQHIDTVMNGPLVLHIYTEV